MEITSITPKEAEKINPQNHSIELKIDGCELTYLDGQLYTKRTNRTKRFPHLLKELEQIKEYALVGECAISENSKVFDITRKENWNKAKLWIYDILQANGKDYRFKPYAERKKEIQKLLSNNNFKHINTPKTFDTFQQGWDYVTKKKAEGLVIKNLNRINQFYKVKKLTEEKLQIIRHEKGSEKGTFILNRKGKEIRTSANSKHIVAQYHDLLKQGKKVMAEIEFCYITKNKRPFQPRLRRIYPIW